MPGKPSDWNVIINGAWNLAILTPDGVARELFELPPGQPVEVRVPLDRRAPIMVSHGRITVVPSEIRLAVSPERPEPGELKRAAAVPVKAIASLPRTPVSAAGVNIRYEFDPVPDLLLTVLESGLDPGLGEAGQIIGRGIKRTLSWGAGHLNLDVTQSKASAIVSFNFHRASADGGELTQWLDRVDEMAAEVRGLLARPLGLTILEDAHV